MKQALPPELKDVQAAARRALSPVKPAGPKTRAHKSFPFNAKRTDAGRALPPYYLVYFLLVDLLGFEHSGKFEKVAWSVPIDFDGQAFLIEHRKLGLGVFAHNPKKEEDAAKEIVVRIHKAVKVARPFFDWLAEQAVHHSHVNVINNSSDLFERYRYFLDAYRQKTNEYIRRKDERLVQKGTSEFGTWQTISFPAFLLNKEAKWLALAAVEAFFNWTEQAFIHLAILYGELTEAIAVASLAEADWADKYKAALNLTDLEAKKFYDKLVAIRKELRNYVAHGAFGKEGEAFTFHSGAGAVPVLLPHRTGSRKFRLGEGLDFHTDAAIEVIEDFISYLWSASRAPAEVYIQNSSLPIILTLAADGTYERAMNSIESMTELVDRLTHQFDNAANMDW
jgi:hypothetical protein